MLIKLTEGGFLSKEIRVTEVSHRSSLKNPTKEMLWVWKMRLRVKLLQKNYDIMIRIPYRYINIGRNNKLRCIIGREFNLLWPGWFSLGLSNRNRIQFDLQKYIGLGTALKLNSGQMYIESNWSNVSDIASLFRCKKKRNSICSNSLQSLFYNFCGRLFDN